MPSKEALSGIEAKAVKDSIDTIKANLPVLKDDPSHKVLEAYKALEKTDVKANINTHLNSISAHVDIVAAELTVYQAAGVLLSQRRPREIR